jgi:parallel beta-helix repeat protein
MIVTTKTFRTVLCAVLLVALSYSHAGAVTNITACGSFGSGSYLVINNITAAASTTCLTLTANQVTIDLNGFTISGSGNTNGILALGRNNVTIRNGSVNGFARAIYANGTGNLIDGVRTATGTLNAFTVGDNATIQNSYVTSHLGGGIIAGKNAKIINSTLNSNSGNMIVVSDGAIVSKNNVTNNGGSSTSAIQMTQNCTVADNVVFKSTFGINATGSFNTIRGNQVTGATEGITAVNSSIISGNNTSSNTDNGIEAGTDNLVSGNTVNANQGVGIVIADRSQVLNNVVNGSGNFGIHPGGPNCSVIGNTTDGNTSSGLNIQCPAKVADNTALGNGAPNLSETGAGCANLDNLAP